MRSLKVEVKISRDLLEKIDMAAKDTFQSRSSFIRQSPALRLNGQYITKSQQKENDFDDMLTQFLPANHPARQNPNKV